MKPSFILSIHLIRKFSFITFLCGFIYIQSISAQVTSASYELVYNENEKIYDVYLLVLQGSASSTRQRVQFNSQVSLVVPAGSKVEITGTYNPFQNNQQYTGTKPAGWELANPLLAPAASPQYDYYSVRPVLFPSAFYNDIKQGDKIKLFSLRIQTEQPKVVRLFKNGVDPGPELKGMMGRDFNNGFCMGGTAQLYTTMD